MPILSNFALSEAFTAISPTQLSLHTAYDTLLEGAHEIVGGLYARQPVVFSVTENPLAALIASNFTEPVVTFAVPAGNTVSFVGLWDDFNNCLGMVPLSSQSPLLFILSADLTTVICPNAFALLDGMLVTNWSMPGVIPNPLTRGTIYQVVNATENTLQLLDLDGDLITPLVFSEVGSGYVQQIQPVAFTADGELGISVITIIGVEIS